jgi:2-polyprenyl-6-methoxyphenol hydroxylase-like FAD-dependent oxidoreductase
MKPSALEEDCDIYVPGDGLMYGNVEDDIELMIRWPISDSMLSSPSGHAKEPRHAGHQLAGTPAEVLPLGPAIRKRPSQPVCHASEAGEDILAGDAAHANNPIGGMGLNGGIQDAANLCDKLERVVN